MRRKIHTEGGVMKDLVPRGIVLATAVLLVLAEYCVFSRPDRNENLMNRDPHNIWEHTVPGPDTWSH